MISVSWNMPSVKAGIRIDFQPLAVSSPVVHQPRSTTSPRPKVGSRPSQTPKTRIRRMPMKKVGSEMPISEIARNALVRNRVGWSAV